MVLKADKLADVVAQACLSVVRMSRVVEKAHNSKTAEALLVRQHLEKASAEAIDSVRDEIQGAHTPADMWQVEKRISAMCPMRGPRPMAPSLSTITWCPTISQERTGWGGESSEIAEAEEDFRKSISTLVSTVNTEGAKVPGECGAALTSSILCLVPTLPLDPVLSLIIDLPLEKECRITLGDASWNLPVSQNIVSSLPSSPLTRGASAPTVAGRSTLIWPGHDPACHIYATNHGLSFLQETCKHPCLHTPKSVGNPKCMQLSFVEGIPYVTSGYSGSH